MSELDLRNVRITITSFTGLGPLEVVTATGPPIYFYGHGVPVPVPVQPARPTLRLIRGGKEEPPR